MSRGKYEQVGSAKDVQNVNPYSAAAYQNLGNTQNWTMAMMGGGMGGMGGGLLPGGQSPYGQAMPAGGAGAAGGGLRGVAAGQRGAAGINMNSAVGGMSPKGGSAGGGGGAATSFTGNVATPPSLGGAYQLGAAPQMDRVMMGQAPTSQTPQLGAAPQVGMLDLGAAPQINGPGALGQAPGMAGVNPMQVQGPNVPGFDPMQAYYQGFNQYAPELTGLVSGQTSPYAQQQFELAGQIGKESEAALRAQVAGEGGLYTSGAQEARARAYAQPYGQAVANITGQQNQMAGNLLTTALQNVPQSYQFGAGMQAEDITNRRGLQAQLTGLGGQLQAQQQIAGMQGQNTRDIASQDVMARLASQQAGLTQERDLSQAGYNTQRALANQGWGGQYGLNQAQLASTHGLANQQMAGQYGMQQGNMDLQRALANQQMQGQYGLGQGNINQSYDLARAQMQGQTYGTQMNTYGNLMAQSLMGQAAYGQPEFYQPNYAYKPGFWDYAIPAFSAGASVAAAAI